MGHRRSVRGIPDSVRYLELRIEGNTRFLEAVAVAKDPLVRHRPGSARRHEPDSPMTSGDEVLDEPASSLPIVSGDRRHRPGGREALEDDAGEAELRDAAHHSAPKSRLAREK